ncbi:E3 ubiquitin-protein ligase RLIM-like [Triticum dicoccoides]|uniref:E3 ubiquitin-protein ligase RLIM-like n=1 Tax=Triticum dicoccoides TaxID=85692 RepID=UPI000E7C07F2|nr:E3 ubiquitin-protein ligase RLIM-like [Triticum dicoccoides]
MDEHMGRRTVGGLLFTKGGSILLFREDSSRRKAGACCSRNGCNGTRHSADKGRPMHSHREAASAAAKEAAPTPRRSQPVRKPPQGSSNPAGPCSETDNGTGEAAAPGAGRDLLARLKDRVNASRKRSLAREMSSPSSSSGGFSASSSGGGATRSSAVSRPTRCAASRIRKADEGESAGGSRRVPRRDTGGGGGARGNSDDPVMVGQRAAREQAPTEGFISGFLARYRGSLQGGSSLQDGAEDSSGYWRFDVEGSEELENYFMLSDRHRAMRMDIDGMSYEELLALGDRIGTVNTGLSEDALYKCLKRSLYTPTAPETHQDCDRKCSICQEEYSGGEEVGNMACKHYYHIACIQHWLRQKNWCPICKSVAAKTV